MLTKKPLGSINNNNTLVQLWQMTNNEIIWITDIGISTSKRDGLNTSFAVRFVVCLFISNWIDEVVLGSHRTMLAPLHFAPVLCQEAVTIVSR